MKAALCGVSALGACGIYLFAGSPGPDFDRVVNKPPLTVYAAFSALAPAGSLTQGPTADMPHRVTRRVEKMPGTEIRYQLLLDDRPVIDADLHFAPGPDNKGTQFDSNPALSFTLGAGGVIRGWDTGVVGMRVGGQRRLTIPPELAYGSGGRGPIPGNATLVFDIELLSVQ